MQPRAANREVYWLVEWRCEHVTWRGETIVGRSYSWYNAAPSVATLRWRFARRADAKREALKLLQQGFIVRLVKVMRDVEQPLELIQETA